MLNAWLPGTREERDEDYYKDAETFKHQLEQYPKKWLSVSDLIGFSEEYDIGWDGHVRTLLDDCPDIKEWFSAYLEKENYADLNQIGKIPPSDELLDVLVEFMTGMNIADYGGFSFPEL